ncbi:MAG: ATP-binding protein, partial [Clostridia bacterium]|nr:ATP-binding protein [Clostridia bacterium]
LSISNEEEHCFEIVSKRNDQTIPLKYESDGIRRMVSILSLLIAVYNEESFTVAIDEIDSGIFEYLLGEVLAVMSESIKGQFIFTSHNLRALEVLPAKYLCFTTNNPENRFTTLPHRGNSNMRDTYFRKIVLGSDKESVYNSTDRFEIERAFYKAGHSEESSYE